MNDSIIGYMDMVDWQHEIGCASRGNRVYPSIEDLKSHRACWSSCGIVEVEVSFKRVVESQHFLEEETYEW